MARIKLNAPDEYSFSCEIPVRITDINYGGHVGNDAVLALMHEARMQYFNSLGYTEMDLAGTGMIMADAAIEFKAELFYGDVVIASVTAAEFSSIGFDLFYKLEKKAEGKPVLAAIAKTGMVCYDYNAKKIARVPVEAKQKMLA